MRPDRYTKAPPCPCCGRGGLLWRFVDHYEFKTHKFIYVKRLGRWMSDGRTFLLHAHECDAYRTLRKQARQAKVSSSELNPEVYGRARPVRPA